MCPAWTIVKTNGVCYTAGMSDDKKKRVRDSFGAGNDVPRAHRLKRIAAHFGIDRIKRHLFLCAGPDCCSSDQGLATWNHLKSRHKALWPNMEEAPVYRTRVECLRVCTDGPIMVVYPDGTWYHGVTPDVVDRILEEHVIGGVPVEEFFFARNPIGQTPDRSS